MDDAGVSIVSGAEAEPWAQINASSSAALSVVTPGRDDASSHEMWLESGVANAGGFCWAPSSEAASKAADASRVPYLGARRFGLASRQSQQRTRRRFGQFSRCGRWRRGAGAGRTIGLGPL